MRATLMPKTHDVRIADVPHAAIFDRTVGLEGVPDGYRAMNERQSLEVLIRP
jgi:hypothetical protein